MLMSEEEMDEQLEKYKIQEEIDKLEKERLEYLEADMNRQASNIQKKINRLMDKQELQELRKLKNIRFELDRYKQFIHYKRIRC